MVSVWHTKAVIMRILKLVGKWFLVAVVFLIVYQVCTSIRVILWPESIL